MTWLLRGLGIRKVPLQSGGVKYGAIYGLSGSRQAAGTTLNISAVLIRQRAAR